MLKPAAQKSGYFSKKTKWLTDVVDSESTTWVLVGCYWNRCAYIVSKDSEILMYFMANALVFSARKSANLELPPLYFTPFLHPPPFTHAQIYPPPPI